MSAKITAEEIEKLLSGMTTKAHMLALLASPGQRVDLAVANDILSHDSRTAAVLERLVADGTCSVTTNRWFPGQYRQMDAILAEPEFADIRKHVQKCNTGADVVLRDARRGNIAIAAIGAPTAEAVIAAMKKAKKDLASKNKQTAAMVAAEREVNHE